MPTDKKKTAAKKPAAKPKASAAKKKPAAAKAKTKAKASAGASKRSGAKPDTSATMAGYISGMKASLKEWGIEIDTLMAKADTTGAGMRKEINHQIKVLRAKEKEASTRLQHLLEATGPAWRDFANGIERAVHDLKESLEKGAKGKKSK